MASPTRPKVVVAETIDPGGLKSLAETCELVDAVGHDRESLFQLLADAEGLVIRSGTKADAELIRNAPRLRVIGRAGIGVDNIDVEAATEAGVLVVNAPQANTFSAAEHTMGLLLAAARKIPAADASVRRGEWDRQRFRGTELSGKVLGVVGLGRIGTLVAERAGAFGMVVAAFDPFVAEERGIRLGIELKETLKDLLSISDFVTVHLPRSPQTMGLIGSEAFGAIKHGAILINTSRGGIVDEVELAAAVKRGVIAGAALDVFEEEPLGDSPLRDLANVVLTPHLAASTIEAQERAGHEVAAAVTAALAGELVLTAVNLDIGVDMDEQVRSYLPLAERLGRLYMAIAGGLPSDLEIVAEGDIGLFSPSPLRLAVLKGALSAISMEPVSYVNALGLARERGINATVRAQEAESGFISALRVEAGAIRVGGTIGRRGPVIVELYQHEIELPLSDHLVILQNSDTPGVIGRVGTYLGDVGVNIADMAVGRAHEGGSYAVMALSLERPVDPETLEGLRKLDGVESAVSVDLS